MKCLVIILISVGLAWTMLLDQDAEKTEGMITGKSVCMWPMFCEIFKYGLNH